MTIIDKSIFILGLGISGMSLAKKLNFKKNTSKDVQPRAVRTVVATHHSAAQSKRSHKAGAAFLRMPNLHRLRIATPEVQVDRAGSVEM